MINQKHDSDFLCRLCAKRKVMETRYSITELDLDSVCTGCLGTLAIKAFANISDVYTEILGLFNENRPKAIDNLIDQIDSDKELLEPDHPIFRMILKRIYEAYLLSQFFLKDVITKT